MKYVKQFVIIIFITFLGELLHYYLPLPVPASIYGMLLLFAALEFKVIRLDAVKETGDFLIQIMPVMFIPAGVGILDAWGVLQPVILPVAVIMAVSTVAVMGVSALVTQAVIRSGKKKEVHTK
ncbi:MAG: CidA/LrgA family protein [Eubacterium sp.]|nr:CidA/LrgA family protein [Eubacterium sp.]